MLTSLSPADRAFAPSVSGNRNAQPLFAGKGYEDPRPDADLIAKMGPIAENLLSGKPIPEESMAVLREQAKGLVAKKGFLPKLLVSRMLRRDRLPMVANRFKITAVDLPKRDIDDLRATLRPSNAAFMAPNHPEYMTDWLIDKLLVAQAAPMAASFAAAGIVQSGGDFWLKNNLIANNGGEQAKSFAIDWALQGNGVLLHPEGTVHWTGDHVGQLLPGVADMAIAAAEQAEPGRLVYIQSPVWKLAFDGDASKALKDDMANLEKRLDLPKGKRKQSPAERYYQLQQNILSSQYQALKLAEPDELKQAPFFVRYNAFMQALLTDLRSRHEIKDEGTPAERINRLGKAVKARKTERKNELVAQEQAAGSKDKAPDAELRSLSLDQRKVDELVRLRSFAEAAYGRKSTITQEEIAEGLKAIRASLVHGHNGYYNHTPVVGGTIQKMVDEFAKTMPEPHGERTAYIRIAPRINVSALLAESKAKGEDPQVFAAGLLDKVSDAMQGTLDALNDEIEKKSPRNREANPFVQN